MNDFSLFMDAITPWVWGIAVVVTLVILARIGVSIRDDGWEEFGNGVAMVMTLVAAVFMVSWPLVLWIDSLK